MKTVNTFALLILLCVLLTGCCRKIAAPMVTEKTVIKDSIVEIIRDSLIVIPADSSLVKALLECDSVGNVRLKELLSYKAGQNIKPPTIIIKDNVLTALSATDSVNIYLALKDRYQYSVQENDKTIKEIVEVNRLTRWQSFFIVLGRISSVLIIFAIGFCSLRIYRKLKGT